MKVEDFVVQIRKSVVDENSVIDRELFEDTTTTVTDPYWIRARSLYASLESEQQDILLEIMRQVAIDTVSNVFAIMDGVTELEGQDGAVRVQCGADELSGELQDRFLEQFED